MKETKTKGIIKKVQPQKPQQKLVKKPQAPRTVKIVPSNEFAQNIKVNSSQDIPPQAPIQKMLEVNSM